MFKNKENIAHTSKETGEVFWVSRAVCVAIRLRVKTKDGYYHLATKRGGGVSNTGEWCFPCGYMDWNETTTEAAQRELYEETGIFYPLSNFYRYDINDDPDKDDRQNVTFHYDVTIFDYNGVILESLKNTVSDHLELQREDLGEEKAEVSEFAFLLTPSGKDFAFLHDKRFSQK